MENGSLLIVAIAQRCRGLIEVSKGVESDLPPALRLPPALHRNHLLWMCECVENHVEEWPEAKLHRWMEFIQGGMLVNRMLDFETAKGMFDEAKNAYESS